MPLHLPAWCECANGDRGTPHTLEGGLAPAARLVHSAQRSVQGLARAGVLGYRGQAACPCAAQEALQQGSCAAVGQRVPRAATARCTMGCDARTS
eukprot:scaffold6237_cov336-Prasinococcus_capsulatus_cf.AAC.8